MKIQIIREPISVSEVQALAQEIYGDVVKGVADIDREVIALGGEWHMDANKILVEEGSSQEHIWGFKIYPDKRGNDAVEYISLINIRPHQENRSMEIADPAIRDTIRRILQQLIPDLFV